MNPSQTMNYPEFAVNTSEAACADENSVLDRLEYLLTLREMLTSEARKAYEAQSHADETVQTAQKQARKILVVVVDIIDDLKRLIGDAQRNLSRPAPSTEDTKLLVAKPLPKESSWWQGAISWFTWSKPEVDPIPETPPAPVKDPNREWLETFGRLQSKALNELEKCKIHNVPLLGEDLKTLAFAGNLVKNWVAIKNRPLDGQLVVKEEIRGLWVHHGKNVELIQRGEVTV
jgi:hypothetical protein